MWMTRYTPKRRTLVAISWYWMLFILMILPSVSATGGLLREAQKRRRAHSDNQTFFEHEDQPPQQDEEEESSMNQTVTSVFGCLFGFTIFSAVCFLSRANKYRQAQEAKAEEAKAEELEKEQLRQRNRIKGIFQYRGLQMKLDSHHFFHHEDDSHQSRNTASPSSFSESERKQELEPDKDDSPSNMDDTERRNGDHPPQSEGEDDDLEMGCSQRSPKADDSGEMKEGTASGNSASTTEAEPTRQKDDGNDFDSMEQEQGHACLLDASAPSADHDDEEEKIVLKIPQRNGEPSSSERSLPNMCAICLDGYQTGHTIVWSSNKACAHAFHQSCIVDYLMSQQQKQEQQTESNEITTRTPLKLAPCPICRQTFLPPQDQPKKNKKKKKLQK